MSHPNADSDADLGAIPALRCIENPLNANIICCVIQIMNLLGYNPCYEVLMKWF